ncbi:hypothetical protein HZH66_010842 [Vespula vulgaris]|uniref:Uncharacterized protein n=1 Tax=Vespula vulgaris TaxID=7454 RepID=A0A834JHA7_VESVU|nr:hypothetical protein HZH66_010842 [Vespula vulgaris]
MLKKILIRVRWRILLLCGIGLWIALCANDLYYNNELILSEDKVFPTTRTTAQENTIKKRSTLMSISHFIEQSHKSWGTIRKSRVLTTFVVIFVSIWFILFTTCFENYIRRKSEKFINTPDNKKKLNTNSSKKTLTNVGVQVPIYPFYYTLSSFSTNSTILHRESTTRFESNDTWSSTTQSNQEWFSIMKSSSNILSYSFEENQNEQKIIRLLQYFLITMGTLNYFLFAILFGSIVQRGKCSNIKLNEYLSEKLREAKVNIAKSHIEASQTVFVNNYNVSWLKSWDTIWDTNPPLIINTFNQMLFAHTNGTMDIFMNGSTSSKVFKFKEKSTIGQGYFIKFVRTIKWKTTLYLFLCYNIGWCSLYTGNDITDLIHRQHVIYSKLIDACFFTKANRLYLILVDNISVIYHWAGTYMDIYTNIMTSSAVSVTTFKYKQSVIIIFAQNSKSDSIVTSTVYEFKENTIDIIQFLPTNKPMSIHHYTCNNHHFVLMINKMQVSSVYLWDGTELLKWIDIPEIRTFYSMQTVYLQDGTYFIVAHNDVVELFKLLNMANYVSLSVRKLNNNRNIVDMQALNNGYETITLILTTLSYDGLYFVEIWDLNVKNKTYHENKQMVTDTTRECLSEIVRILQNRLFVIRKFESFMLYSNYSIKNNSYVFDTLEYPSVILKSGVVEKIDLFVEEEVFTPSELRKNLDDLESKIESLLKRSLNILRPNTKNNLYGVINITGDAFFKEMVIDTISIDKLNNVSYRSNNLISLKDDQQFASSLNADNIIVHNLKVNSLCGIPHQYWATIENKDEKILVSENDSTRKLYENSILVHSNISIPNLKVKKINEIDMEQLIDQLFIIGGNQTITGNITYQYVEVKNLKTKMYNGVSSTLLMTNAFDQNFQELYIKTLEVDSLHVEYINGIPISEFAMKSRENVISGEVILDKMEVTEMLIMDSDAKMSIIPPSQIYDSVVISGDIAVKKIDFEENGKLIMDNLKVKPREIFHNMWTKSTDQTIRNDVSLDFGVTIDRLETKYLNGFTEEEFLYTTVEKIPSIFTNLHFKNLHINDVFHVNETKLNSIDVHQDRIIIRGDLHVQKLQLHHLITDYYNNISVDIILNNTGNLKLSEDINLPAISVERAIVREFNLEFLNDRAVSPYLKIPIKVNETELIRTPKFRAEEITIENFNGKNISYLIELENVTIADIMEEIIIENDLVLSEELEVIRIANYSAEMYLKKIALQNISLPTGMMEELIVQNITMDFLEGFRVDTLPSSIFSKIGSQKIPGRFTFHTIRADNMEANYINGLDTSKLMWIDEPLIFEGNVTFTDLFVDNDVSVGSLNGYDTQQLYQSPISLTSTNLHNLSVSGHISWENSNQSTESLSHLFEKALRKDTPQEIVGDIEGIDEIRNIIEDAVFENSEKIVLSGQKVFQNNLTMNTLKTQDVIDIVTINGINIIELNASVVNKYEKNIVTGPIEFLNEVIIDNLVFNDTLHDTLNTDLVLSNQILPNNTYIKNLVVIGDIFLKRIDDVDFNEFVENRVTLSKDHVISSDIQFQGRVEVTGNAMIKKINGIDTSDLVINSLQTTQIISGKKTYINDLKVNNNVEIPLINGINLNEEFSNSVLNDENVIITGDLIFQSHVDIPKNIIVSGLVNGVNVSDLVNDLDHLENHSISALKENTAFIEHAILNETSIIKSLPSVFAYLEEEDRLKIEVPTVKKIDVVMFDSILKLNMYAEQNGSFCGLPEKCSCSLQYVAELTKNDSRVWRCNNISIVKHFYKPNNLFGIDVTTSSVSYNAQCSRNETDLEVTTISWMSNEKLGTANIIKERYSIIEAMGFLKDSKTFIHNDQVYITLAIYYDPTTKKHDTNSFIYKLNLKNESLTLHQEIRTNGASALEILQINNNVYIVIACDGNTKMGSLIYKLDSITSMFVLLRRFPGKSNCVKSLSNDDDYFIMINDLDMNALNIYYYDYKFDNFYHYQSFFYDSPINEIQSFYIGEIVNNDGYVIVTTEDGQFYVYEYMFVGKFQRKIVHQIDGLQTVVPFHYDQYHYLLFGTKTNTTIMRIVQLGLH